MRISQALSRARDIKVEFEEATLHVTYRPVSYTLEEMDRLQADTTETGGTKEQRSARIDRVAGTISRLVVSWDLTDEEDRPINPSDIETLRNVPFNIISEVIQAVRRDQQAGEAQSPSVDS